MALAFAAMASVTCLVVLADYLSSRSVRRDIQTAQTARLPASLAAEQAQASLLEMQLRLRSYLVVSDPADLDKYTEASRDFESHLNRLRTYARTWSAADAADLESLSQAYTKWVQLPPRLFELHDNPLKNRPALRIARVDVQPRRVEVMKHLDAMIEEQRGQGQALRGRALLSDIVAFESSFDSLTTNLMAYASSGELNFRFAYGPKLSTNAALWLALTKRQDQLTAQQRAHLAEIARLRAEISDLALQITSYVNGEHAYDDRYLYRAEVEPQAENMMRLLASLTSRQRAMLQADVERIDKSLKGAQVMGIVGGVVAVVLAMAMAAVAYRRIVGPVRSLTQVAEELAAGQPALAPRSETRDEIARLADTIRTRMRQDDLQRIMASVPDALWSAELDSTGTLHYRYCSPVVERIAGRPPEYFVGSSGRWNEIVHPDDRDVLPLALRRISAGQSVREDTEYRICRPDGAMRWVRDSLRATRMSDGNMMLNGVVSDITERRKIEDQLRARQEMLDLAQRVARAVAFELEISAGTKQRWPAELEALHGLQPGAYDGSWKKLVHPDDWHAVRDAIRTARETGDFACEYRVIHGDGSHHWLQAKGRFFFGADNKPTRMVGFMLDVTERHRAEVELERLEARLRQAQRLEAMGTLAGGIAHDFNNILGVILGYGEMVAREVRPGTRLKRGVDSIMAAGERGRALVERILAFSRSAVGDRVPVHVESVVQEALELIAATAPANVALETNLRAGNAAMMGDPTQVHQVLMNLVTNAVQAMPKGGVLRIGLDLLQLEEARLFTTGRADPGPYLVLTVEDSGTGIAADILERIFDPFFTTKEVGVGTGLGLSLVHGIVSQVGGAVDVSTELGAGSVFSAYFPQSGFTARTIDTDIDELPLGHGERVVVVDDEEALARLTGENLVSLGYSGVTFSSSIDALNSMQAHPEDFDLLIADERMPGMSGTVLIREVRRLRPDVPIVVASGNLSADLVDQVRAAGADDVLRKPILLRDLALVASRVLRLDSARRSGDPAARPGKPSAGA